MPRFNFSVRSLRFPKEVGTNDVPNFILFTPMKMEFGKFDANQLDSYGNTFDTKKRSNVSIAGESISNNPVDQLRNGTGGIIENLANGANSLLSSVSNFLDGKNFNLKGNFDLFGGKLSARVDIGNLGLNDSGFQGPSKVHKQKGISLYMPPEISHNLNAGYDVQGLGATGAGILQGAEGVMDILGTYAETGNITDADKKTLKDSAVGFGAGVLIDKLKNVGAAKNLLQRYNGRVANSYTFAVFNGMQHRKFSYNFRLVARSEDDTRMIKDICDSFMDYMLPVKNDGTAIHFYDMPYMWEIGYYRWDNENEFMDQPNECFLESCNITYSGDGMGHTHNNGAPLIVNLALSFVEVQPMFSSGNGDTTGDAALITKGSGSPTPMNFQGGNR